MLKHTSNAGAPATANGQLRNATSSTTTSQSTTTTPTVTTARNIQLRPPQPLNISALNAANIQNTSVANGGSRIPSAAAGTATATTATNTPVTPLTPSSNGILGNHNLHTYTNQHVLAAQSSHHHHHNNTVQSNHYAHNNHQQHHQLQQSQPQHNYSNYNNLTGVLLNKSKHGPGPREALTSLGLLCLVSLLLALLSLIFLLKISPNSREDSTGRNPSEDYVIVYDVTLALCALSLSLNLCCLLVCAIQFLFAVKLVRSPMFDGRDNKYLEKSSVSRTCAVGGFFISIPIFLTGIILYTFNHFHSTPAIITSVLIGIGIVFCGGAMVHNVFIWQKEKTISYRSPSAHPLNMSMISHIGPITPPMQFLNHTNPFNHSVMSNHTQLHHPTSVTPVSPNHSQGSFNPLSAGAVSSSFLIRPSTATPPTPKPLANGCLATLRDTSGSVSPGLPGNLDMSVITSPSLHELSTLV